MRVIAGNLRGKTLYSMHGRQTRPTTDRVRESIFNILASRIPGSVVLDLFAGTGALGIEALSRGARFTVFADNSRKAIAVIRRNIRACRLEHSTFVIKRDICRSLQGIHSVCRDVDLVMMDPPYNRELIPGALLSLSSSNLLKAGASIVVEHSHLEPVPGDSAHFRISDQRKYGQTLVSFFTYVI